MGTISPRDQGKLDALADISRAAHSIYGLTEQFAVARSGEAAIAQQIKRRYGRFKRTLSNAGFDQIAQLAGGMEMAAGRRKAQRTKTRILREGMSSIRHQLDMEERSIRKAGAEAANEKKARKDARKKAAAEQSEGTP